MILKILATKLNALSFQRQASFATFLSAISKLAGLGWTIYLSLTYSNNLFLIYVVAFSLSSILVGIGDSYFQLESLRCHDFELPGLSFQRQMLAVLAILIGIVCLFFGQSAFFLAFFISGSEMTFNILKMEHLRSGKPGIAVKLDLLRQVGSIACGVFLTAVLGPTLLSLAGYFLPYVFVWLRIPFSGLTYTPNVVFDRQTFFTQSLQGLFSGIYFQVDVLIITLLKTDTSASAYSFAAMIVWAAANFGLFQSQAVAPQFRKDHNAAFSHNSSNSWALGVLVSFLTLPLVACILWYYNPGVAALGALLFVPFTLLRPHNYLLSNWLTLEGLDSHRSRATCTAAFLKLALGVFIALEFGSFWFPLSLSISELALFVSFSHAKNKSAEPKILLVGAYGHGNLGDDMLGDLLKKELVKRGHVVELSAGSHATVSHDLSQSRLALSFKIPKYRRVIIGGGGLFDDQFGLGYLRYFGWVAVLASIWRVRVDVLSVGIESVSSFEARIWLRVISRLSQSFTVRDLPSKANAASLGINVAVTPDLGWLSSVYLPDARNENEIIETVAISLAAESGIKESSFIRLNDVLKRLFNPLEMPEVSLASSQFGQTDDKDDQHLLMKFCRDFGFVPVPEEQVNSYAQIYENLSRAKLFVGQRLHVNILAAVAGVPIVAISRSHKVTSALGELEGVVILNLDSPISLSSFNEIFHSALDYRQKRRHVIETRVTEIRAQIHEMGL